MAKLYAEMKDEKGTEVHKSANNLITVRFYYGSRDRPKIAVVAQFSWRKDKEKPDLVITPYDCVVH